jgi:hypothetical protein
MDENKGKRILKTQDKDVNLDTLKAEVYANFTAVASTIDEFFIVFGVHDIGADDPDKNVQGLVFVNLNPVIAKQMWNALKSQIETYERDFGHIETDINKRVTEEGQKRIVKKG